MMAHIKVGKMLSAIGRELISYHVIHDKMAMTS